MASWMRAVAGAGEDGELERPAVGTVNFDVVPV